MKRVSAFLAILGIIVLLFNVFSPIVYASTEIIKNKYTEDNYENIKNTELKDNNETSIKDENITEDENIVENENNTTENTIQNENIIEDNNKIEESNNETSSNTINEDYGIATLEADPSLGVEYRTHVQEDGWQDFVQNEEISGTSGRSLRLEGIEIKLINSDENLNIKYQVHAQNIGWQDWKTNGEMAGTSGQSLRLEAIRICLEDSDEYSIMYRVHVQTIGWQDWKTDGEMAGTSGQSLRLEAIQIKIIPKQKKGRLCIDTPKNGNTYYSESNITVQGWKMANATNSSIKVYIDNTEVNSDIITYYNRKDVTDAILDYGTATQNPKSGFKFNITTADLDSGNHILKIVLYSEKKELTTMSTAFVVDKDIHVQYRGHVQTIGWQGYVKDGEMAGTSGKSYRVEALNINLINATADAKILYRTHVQSVGWQDWKSNGEMAGTSGLGYRVEAIEIKLQNMEDYTVEYQVHVQDIGWTNWYIDGEMAGTFGKSKRIEAIRIRILPHYKRNLKGIDVSQFNGSINWGLVKKDNIDFAFLRVGYRGYGSKGNFANDSMFKINMQFAKASGIPVGVYFVTQAITDAEAIEEANWVIQRIKEYNIEYPVALDIENAKVEPGDTPRTKNLDTNTRTRLAKLFCETIQNAGYTPIIYTNVDWANNKLNMNEFTKYDTWIANYKYDATSKPNYNKAYAIWQYSDAGDVMGILGNVDLNISYKKY